MITYYYYHHLTNIVLLLGQFATMCPKPRHLKHLEIEVLVEDLGVEVEGISLEFLLFGVGSLENFEIDFSF